MVFPDEARFPAGERSTYTAAAVVLAADALAGGSPASGLFTRHDEVLPALFEAERHRTRPRSTATDRSRTTRGNAVRRAAGGKTVRGPDPIA